jgi:hypothetical protein
VAHPGDEHQWLSLAPSERTQLGLSGGLRDPLSPLAAATFAGRANDHACASYRVEME